MKRFGLTELFCGLVLVAILADAALTKKQRTKREAEVAESVQVDRELHRAKRLDLAGSSHEKTLSRVKRLEDERELKRYKRQKRHIGLIKKALEHVKKRSVSAAELKELLRVKRTKRDSGRALNRMKRGKSKSNKVHKRAKKSLKRRTITKRDIQLARALLRKKRTEHSRKLNAIDDKVRTVKKDGKHAHQAEKKHHVRRHKEPQDGKSDSKAYKKDTRSAEKKSKKHVKSNKKEHDLNRAKRH
ncbi:transcriptional regulator ATRX homolog [Liolophura sinensis]|uniref:transcriptional regulator ATRX homolog n=1 Tax=Liolophura sinensis TaxID=3198878 RepID=UPI00315828E7